ncbi:hypothetical protein V2G26_005580 [Clonostachys chloroleuca]
MRSQIGLDSMFQSTERATSSTEVQCNAPPPPTAVTLVEVSDHPSSVKYDTFSSDHMSLLKIHDASIQKKKKKKKKKALPLFPKAAPMPLVSLGAKDRAELSHPILLDAALSH